MKTLILIFILLFLFSCKVDESKKLDFKVFEITFTEPWSKIKLPSCTGRLIGEITNDRDSLFFDYGSNSPNFDSNDFTTHIHSISTINGKKALLIKPDVKGKGTTGAYFKNVIGENSLTIYGNNIANENALIKAFKTITFPNSDTTINSNKIVFNKENNPYKGLDVFRANCASCHHLEKHTLGPSFNSMSNQSFEKWILSNDITDTVIREVGQEFHQNSFYEKITEENVQDFINLSKDILSNRIPLDTNDSESLPGLNNYLDSNTNNHYLSF